MTVICHVVFHISKLIRTDSSANSHFPHNARERNYLDPHISRCYHILQLKKILFGLHQYFDEHLQLWHWHIDIERERLGMLFSREIRKDVSKVSMERLRKKQREKSLSKDDFPLNFSWLWGKNSRLLVCSVG